MRISFVNPPGWQGKDADGRWVAWCRAGSRWPFTSTINSAPDRPVFGDYTPAPLFLQYAASYARKHLPGAHVAFRDSIALRDSYATYFRWLKEGRYDLAVIESATPSWEHDRELIRLSRVVCPQTEFVLCGPIASAPAARQALEDGLVVAAAKGEYERGVVRVVNGERGLIDFDFLSREDMNQAPPPWLDWTHAHRYCDGNPQGQKFPHLHWWTSRGCWAKCLFCVFPAVMTSDDPDGTKRRTVRLYDANKVQDELTEAVARFGYRSVWFDDDLFNQSDRHVMGICGAMRHVRVPWSCMCRADTISPETWREMKAAGCFGVKVGVESGSQHVLDKIVNKRLDLGDLLKTLTLLREIGMVVHTTFTVGLPGETQAQQRETLDLIDRLYREGLTTTHQLSGMAEIEGTPAATLHERGRLEKYSGASCGHGYEANADGADKLRRMALPLA